MPRKILHVDLDAFFCAVEEIRDPLLRGKAFAVGGLPNERGVVASCSYEARRFGVHSAMPMSRAVRLCPPLIIVSQRHGEYHRLSDKVMEMLGNLTPLVEQISIDEAFLDVSDLPDPPGVIAHKLQRDILDGLKLPNSIGAASNKLVSKIATEVGKAAAGKGTTPNAITVVPPGDESAFLSPLPIEMLWGVGPKTAAQLNALGIHTIGDVARYPRDTLARRFGKNGEDLWFRAQGIDDRPLVSGHAAKSISQETTFVRDVNDPAVLRRTLRELSEGVGRRLRESNLAGTTVKLKLRWPDFTTLSRQSSFEFPADQDDEIYEAALALFETEWRPGRRVRLLGVGASGLRAPLRQLSLWDDDSEKQRGLQQAVDELRARFGARTIRRGGTG